MRIKQAWRVALLAVLLLAFFLRVYRLDAAPPGLYYDEAAHGLEALQIWQGRLYLFFPTANGHEPLFTYIVAPFVRVLGNTILALRLPAAMFGVLAVAACFALGRRLIGPWPAIFATALIAITLWTVALSRIGYRANTLPVLFPLWLLAFWRCHDRRDWQAYFLAGLLLGLTQYTYTAARFIPILALILAFDWRRQLTRRGLWISAVTAAVVVLPLALAILGNLDAGSERIRDAWLFSRPQPLALLWWQLRDHLLMFGFTGDPLWIHNIPLRTPVILPLALLFWLAVMTTWRQAALRTLTLSVGVLLWPGILAVSNNPAPPDHLRIIEVATPVFLLVAAGLQQVTRQRAILAVPLALALILYDGGRSWLDYSHWSTARETYEQFDADMTRLAKKIEDHPDLFYIIPLSPDWHEFEPGKHWTIEYLAGYPANYAAVTVPYVLPQIHAEHVALVKWQAGMHLSADPQRTLEGQLKLLGYTKVSDEVENTFLLEYYEQTNRQPIVFRFAPQEQFEGGLTINEVNLYLTPAADGKAAALNAELAWESPGPYDEALSVSLRIQNAAGAVVAQVDSWLWNDLGETAEKWRRADSSRLFLEVDAGALEPGIYSLTLLPYYTASLAPLARQNGGADYGVGEFTVGAAQ